MLQRHLSLTRFLLLGVDAGIALVLFVLASLLRFGGAWQDAWARAGAPWWLFAAAYAGLWMIAAWVNELDRPRARWRVGSEVGDIFRAVALLAVAVFSLLFLVQAPEVSRKLLIVLFLAQLAVTVTERILLREALAGVVARGMGTRRILVLGTGPRATGFVAVLRRHPELAFHLVGHLGPARDVDAPVLGPLGAMEEALHEYVVDEVVACLEPDETGLLEPAIALCLEEGKTFRMPLPVPIPMTHAGRVESLDGIEIITVSNSPDRVLGLVAKRAIDVVVAALALLLLLPLFAAIAAIIVTTDGRPVLFRQTRVGLHGREFTIYKFRSMVRDAEGQLADLADQNVISGHAFKLEDDPRITRIGRFLRRTSVDEFPQFWNVLRGDMSIVGPRPPLPGEVANYDLWHRRRLSMKPGVTGLWQVSARLDAEFDRWVELDLSYIDRWSLWLDIKIMLRTLPAMLSGR